MHLHAGHHSFQPPSPFIEPTGRRIRVRLGDEIVAQSDRALLLVQYGPGGLPFFQERVDIVVEGVHGNVQRTCGLAFSVQAT